MALFLQNHLKIMVNIYVQGHLKENKTSKTSNKKKKILPIKQLSNNQLNWGSLKNHHKYNLGILLPNEYKHPETIQQQKNSIPIIVNNIPSDSDLFGNLAKK